MADRELIVAAFGSFAASHLGEGSWRLPGDQGVRYTEPSYQIEVAQMLDRLGFDAVIYADVLGPHDVYRGSAGPALCDGAQVPNLSPLPLIAALASHTRRIGFVATVASTYRHPYDVARDLATIDHWSSGRLGINVVTGYSGSAARGHGLAEQIDHDQRYDMADEWMEVIYQLTEGSWRADAVVRDAARGVYVDPARVRSVSHHGRYWSSAGSALCEPSPQRLPLIMQAGSSRRGLQFAGRHAEAVFVNGTSLAATATAVARVRDAVARAGRDPRSVKVLALVTVITARSAAAAQAKEAAYRAAVTGEGTGARVGGWTGIDLADYDPDLPLADQLPASAGADAVRSIAVAHRRRTPRELIATFALGGSGALITGDPTTVADHLQRWSAPPEAGGADIDGIALGYATQPGTWRDFGELVMPELRHRGVLATAPAGTTLRERWLGAPHTLDDHPAAALRRVLHDEERSR